MQQCFALNVGRNVRVLVALASLLVTTASDAAAQALQLKRMLAAGNTPGCLTVAPARPAGDRRDNAEARRLATVAQDAALVGDRVAARDAFARAAALDPGNDRIAYDLGRANEEVGDTAAAVAEFCRYLVLSPQGREASDVRSRLPRLVPRSVTQSSERILQFFQSGVSHYDARRFDDAAAAFDNVVRVAPRVAEALYNRAVARLAAGHREQASRDFEAYLAADPAASDRTEVARTIDALRRPVFEPGTALRVGLVPGVGQFYTKRPAFGMVTILAVAGSAIAAAYQRTETRTVPYVDPNGVPAPYEEEYKRRPYLVPGLGAAVGITFAAALESYFYARRSSVTAAPTASTSRRSSLGEPARRDVRLAPLIGSNGAVGLHLHASF